MGDMKNERLLPISANDEEVFRTVLLMSKLKSNREEIKEKLFNHYNRNRDDFNTAFAYASYCILPSDTDDIMMQKDSVEEALEVFESIIEKQPGNWIARYNKIKILSLYTDNFRDNNDLIEDIKALIEEQNKAEYKPYFILPHLLYAEMMFNEGQVEESKECIEKAALMEQKNVGFLEDFLYHQTVVFTSKLYASGEYDIADKVKNISKALFSRLAN